ncbi:hypothetical protein EVA_11514 [gut metagenome]|uniref:Uncharacterized protein n=1 Tax=gut metagenome TaxID=749906 RepID=J9G0L5_9ZZZZ
MIDDLEEGGFIRFWDRLFRSAQYLCKLRQIAVFLIGFQTFFITAAEGIVRKHHDRQLLGDSGRTEALPIQQFLLGIDLHSAAEVHIYFLAVGMGSIFQIADGLGQNRLRRHKPNDSLGFSRRQCIEYRANGVAGQKGLAAARWNLEAQIWNTGHNILITAQGRSRLLTPKIAKRCCIILCLVQQFQIAAQILNRFFLIRFHFHTVPPPYNLLISRGIFLNVIPICASLSSPMEHRSA